MNKKKVILVITVGVLFLGFVPAVAAGGRVTERPLDDWLDVNYAALPWGVAENWAFADFASPYTNLVCKMGFPFPLAGFGPFVNDMIYENSLVIGDTIIDGNIKERELNDGRALVTLQLDVKNAPCSVYDYTDFIFYCLGFGPYPQVVLGDGIDGYIDYTVLVKFYIPEPGAPLPDIFSIWDNYISVNIIGTGFGILTERAVELGFASTAGVPGRVRLHQIALVKPDFIETHPKYDPFYGEMWPCEQVEIFEMS